MQTPRIHRRFWLLAGLGLVLVGGGSGSVHSGEKVTFSDSEKAGAKLEQSRTPPAQRSPRFENFLDRLSRPRGSSLDAVAPPPFAPTSPGGETVTPLTEKEWQQLKERQNWIQRRPEDLDKELRDPHRMFGVREQSTSGTPASPKARQGWLSDYYQQLGNAQAEAESALPGPLRDRRRDAGRAYNPLATENSSRLGAAESLRPVGARGFASSDAAPQERSPALAADLRFTEKNPRESGSGNEKGNREPSWLRSASGPDPVRLGFTMLPGAPVVPVNPAQEDVNRLLGNRTLGNSLAVNPVNSLDPVSTFPDPTREVLNPVTPVRSGVAQDSQWTPAAQPSLVTPPTRSRMLSSAPGILGPEAPGTAQTPLSQTPGATTEDRRGLHSIKLNLELPPRSF